MRFPDWIVAWAIELGLITLAWMMVVFAGRIMGVI
jgi:hypothetical protein